jgi:myo-inositol-1(or 4)-monophosphatase
MCIRDRLPTYSISVALAQGDKIIMGTVLDVRGDECYTAFRESPASMNGKEIRVSGRNELGESLLATGFPTMILLSRKHTWMYCHT